MDPLPPIPIPPALRWREFRIRALPALLFLAAILGVVFIWQNNISSPTLVGVAETRTARIVCPHPGTITELKVSRFQTVTQGTVLAIIEPNDPRAALAVIQADLDLLNTKLGLHLTAQRNQTSYEGLQINWLQQKVDLAIARVDLDLARTELKRDFQLHQQQLISDYEFDISVKNEQSFATQVLERSNLVVATESGIHKLGADQPAALDDERETFLINALHVEEQKLKAAVAGAGTVTLTAPMDGMVNVVYRQAGENVLDGDLLLTLSAVKPEHIIGYLREPLPFEPKVGLPIEVRTRTMKTKSGLARIEHVGSQFEPITNGLAIVRPGALIDLGLAVEISLPPELNIRPGEIVDLTLLSDN